VAASLAFPVTMLPEKFLKTGVQKSDIVIFVWESIPLEHLPRTGSA
jgi:hypothetical protein